MSGGGSSNSSSSTSSPEESIAYHVDHEDPFSDTAPDEHFSRYLAYGGRLRTVVFAARRYLAYTSDFGEAFRPVVPPALVRSAYAVSWLYVLYDVGHEGWRLHDQQQPVALGMTKRLAFQGLASMALPAATIHTTVNVTARLLKHSKWFGKWGPTVAGLAVVPALPYLFDRPVETLLDEVFFNLEHEVLHPEKKSK